MIRTQVYLEKHQAQEISFLARRRKKAKAEVIRSLIQKGLESEKGNETIGQALQKLADVGKKYNAKGPKDLSTTIDTYLYNE